MAVTLAAIAGCASQASEERSESSSEALVGGDCSGELGACYTACQNSDPMTLTGECFTSCDRSFYRCIGLPYPEQTATIVQ